jgi:hypothetical protein
MDYYDEDGIIDSKKILESIKEVDGMLKEEEQKQNVDADKITRLRFEQMLRGLYINNDVAQLY